MNFQQKWKDSSEEKGVTFQQGAEMADPHAKKEKATKNKKTKILPCIPCIKLQISNENIEKNFENVG